MLASASISCAAFANSNCIGGGGASFGGDATGGTIPFSTSLLHSTVLTGGEGVCELDLRSNAFAAERQKFSISTGVTPAIFSDKAGHSIALVTVPEPGILVMLLGGFGMFAMLRRTGRFIR